MPDFKKPVRVQLIFADVNDRTLLQEVTGAITKQNPNGPGMTSMNGGHQVSFNWDTEDASLSKLMSILTASGFTTLPHGISTCPLGQSARKFICRPAAQ